MNKFRSISLIVFSILLSGILNVFNVSASSVYDLNYQTTDSLRISSYNNAVSIEDVELKYQLMINGLYDEHTIRYNTGSGGNGNPGSTQQQFIANEWNNAKQRWAISQSCDADQPLKGCSIMLYYTVDDSLGLQWNTNTVNVANPGQVRRIKISWYESIPGILVEYKSFTSGSESGNGFFGGAISGLTNQNSRVRNYIAYTDHPNYPEGYEGLSIRDSIQPPVYTEALYTWSVDVNGKLNVYYNKNLEPSPMEQATVNLFGFTENFYEGEPIHTDDELDDEGWLDFQVFDHLQDLNYTYENLPSAGFYTVRIEYLQLIDDDDIETVRNVVFDIRWDGKSFISGTNNNNCTIGENESIDCSTETNKNPFLTAFSSVDVPTYGIQAIIVAPLGFISSLLSHQSTCSPLVLPLNLYQAGTKNLTLPCMESVYRDYIGDVLIDFYQTVMLALVSYYVFIRILASIKNANDPRTNQIEVAKL